MTGSIPEGLCARSPDALMKERGSTRMSGGRVATGRVVIARILRDELLVSDGRGPRPDGTQVGIIPSVRFSGPVARSPWPIPYEISLWCRTGPVMAAAIAAGSRR